MQLMGLRELGHGLAILSNSSRRRPSGRGWPGDLVDLALLGRTWANPENDRGRHAVRHAQRPGRRRGGRAHRTAALAAAAQRGQRADGRRDHPHQAQHHRAPPRRGGLRLLARLREPAALHAPPRVGGRHRRGALALEGARPGRQTVEWDAETTADEPNERIAWRSLPGAAVYNAGEVRFQPAPGGRGTELRVTLEYDPPFGKLGSKVAMLFREEPGQQVADDLRHFKQVMETGEIVLSDATKQRGPHPARPNDKPVQL
jgi:hypothetical protein